MGYVSLPEGKSKVVSTHLWNTPRARNLYQQAIIRDSFHNWRCERGIGDWVCEGSGVWHAIFMEDRLPR